MLTVKLAGCCGFGPYNKLKRLGPTSRKAKGEGKATVLGFYKSLIDCILADKLDRRFAQHVF